MKSSASANKRNPSSRLVSDKSVQHVYKRTLDNGVLFYRSIDRLVFFTIQSVCARKHRVQVLVASYMYTHVHEAVRVFDASQLAAYERDVNSIFAKEYNRETGRTGPVFESPYGRAPKMGDKSVRSCLAYVVNNPVEKKLCRLAEEDRWTFLAYYTQAFPFSKRPQLSRARSCLREAIKIVSHECAAGRYLHYALLHRLFAPLDHLEREQLTDYIIQCYFFFDSDECCRYFGTIDKMVAAVGVVTGSEFDVGEVFEPFSDIPYKEMCDLAEKQKLLGRGLPFLHFPEERVTKFMRYLREHTSATERQLSRFLHQPRVSGNAWGFKRGE